MEASELTKKIKELEDDTREAIIGKHKVPQVLQELRIIQNKKLIKKYRRMLNKITNEKDYCV